ncbi:PIN domain-containing protein, partial [Mycobacterium tuberculosis]|uniref:PIN domain-containing protein n=1 Tax=Mycobacterium tuberculosis TaxID=1773 RepID=UPI000459D30F
MIVDTSAIVAIVSGESGAQVLKEALERSPNSRMSAPNYVELCAIMQRRDRPEISRLVDRLLDDYGIQVEAVDADQARVEPPRHVRRLQFLERMGSCQVVHRGGTRRSCV